MVLKDNDTILQYFGYNEEEQLGKLWKRIDSKLHTDLLRILVGPDRGNPVAQADEKNYWQQAGISNCSE